MKKNILELGTFYLYLIILETFFAYTSIGHINLGNIPYLLFFTLNIATVIMFIFKLFSAKASRVIKIITSSIIGLYFYGQFIFFKIFKMPFSFSSISMADQAYDFRTIIISTISKNLIPSILFALIIIIFSILYGLIKNQRRSSYYGFSVIVFLISSVISLCLLKVNENKTYSAYNLYYNISSPTQSLEKFGLLTTTNLDLSRQLFGFETTLTSEAKSVMKQEKNTTKYNTEDIDFDKLISKEMDNEIKSLHQYFATDIPTNKNEYTGYYKDKNLIFILAEGFNSLAVDKELTPTLYKMVNNSFVFNNFYSPLFLSTTGGEFQSTISLLPTQQILKNWKTTTPYLPYSYGNAFQNKGYYVSSYHNWTYSYYDRDKTMPTQGFTNYTACGNGLENLMDCNSWPTSDIDMINATTDKYIKQKKFMTFYITVSGHAEYNFSGNAMAKKNQALVEDLDYSTQIKAYLATQIELDRALETLLKELEEKKILDDTVIALVGDHYPYTISADVMNEKSPFIRDELFEVNRSNFILYNSKTPKTEIKKYASNLDVLPTILNLFGIEYDSRLLMGKDIFSDTEGLVIFSDHSWISDKGKYNVTTKEFTPFTKNISEDYIEMINSKVANKFTISDLLIKKNYYTIIKGK